MEDGKDQKEDYLYSDFNEYNPNFDPRLFERDENFQNAIQNVKDKRPPPTAARLKTGSKRGLIVPPSSMGMRPITGAQDGGVGRPLTAVRAAGYTSKDSSFDGLNQTSKVSPIIFEQKTANTPEEIIKISEKAINKLLDESCLANARGEFQLALERAKEAERQEKLLMDKKKRLTPNIEQVNLDLNYAVRFNLAIQQAANNMDNEAIATYQSLIKSRAFNHSGRLKVNIGNIYFKLRNFEKAVKFYKMALDQVSQEHKSMNTKIKLNICATYVKMNLFQDAATVLELIMDQEPSIKTAFTLTLCYYLLGDSDLMKRTYERMLALDREPTEDEKYLDSSDDPQYAMILEVIRNDPLRQMEKQKTNEAEQSIMMAAKIIAGAIDTNYSAGYDWCINQVRSSHYMSLAHDLDIDKAISYLKQKDFQQAIETLKSFEKKDSKVASAAATNLSFLYNLENQPSQADKYAEVALQADRYNPAALVNKGNVLYKRGDLERAREYYNEALQNDSSCIEALYNFGLANKKLGRCDEAHGCFTKLLNILRSHPQVLFQLADINSLMGNQDQAKEWLMQVNTMVPSDPIVIRQLAEMFEAEDDKIQALHYYSEAYKFDPTNIMVLEWLGSYFVESQMPENAVQYFERGAFLQPGQAKWPLMIASCFRRIGSYQQAHELYKHIHRRFPDNIECLKILAKFCVDMNLEDAKKYTDKLKEVEKSHQLREERAASGRTRSGKSRSDQGSDSRQSSGGLNRGNQSRQSSAGMRQGSPHNSMDRPRTAAKRGERSNADDFDDEEIGDDLLPE